MYVIRLTVDGKIFSKNTEPFIESTKHDTSKMRTEHYSSKMR